MGLFDEIQAHFHRQGLPARKALAGASFRWDYTDTAGVAVQAAAIAQQEGWQAYSAPVDQGSIVATGDPTADAAQSAKLGIQLYDPAAMSPNQHEFYFRQTS